VDYFIIVLLFFIRCLLIFGVSRLSWVSGRREKSEKKAVSVRMSGKFKGRIERPPLGDLD